VVSSWTVRASRTTCAARRRWQASRTRRSGSAKPERSRDSRSSSACSVWSKRAWSSRAVGPRGETTGSRGGGTALCGSRSSASRVAASGARRHVARNASASRVRRPWRVMASPNFTCSARGNAARACAMVAESRPSSTCAASGAASRRPSIKRRSTQPRPRPSSLAICVGVRWSSSASERTMRASSIGLSVRRGALASSSRALRTTPGASSTTTGTCVCPSPVQLARRLKPSSTS
jgi:hypothetical protein